MMIIKLMVIRT